MALPQNRKAVMAILEEISPRIIGRRHRGFTCSCGAIHADPGVVTAIEPAGDDYPGQEVCWAVWSVQIRHHPEDPKDMNGFGCGLSEYLPVEVIKAIFAKHFGPNPDRDNPFELPIHGEKRVRAGLPLAVRIQNNNERIRFCFDWGRDQDIAVALNMIERGLTSQRCPNESADFEKIFNFLKSIDSPVVYQGGPEPELPFESTWLLDYGKALDIAKKTNHVFLSVGGCYISHGVIEQTNGDVVFMKYHLD